METLDTISKTLSRIGAIAAGLVLVAMTAFTVLEIALRSLFGTSTLMAEELVGYGLGAFTFLAMGYSLRHDVLLRLTLALDMMSRNVKRWTLAAGMILTLVVSSFLAYSFWVSVAQKFRGGTLSGGYSQIPLWIPEAFVLLGLAIFTLQAVVEIWRLFVGKSIALETTDASELKLEKEVLL